jgi:hypothetical protein
MSVLIITSIVAVILCHVISNTRCQNKGELFYKEPVTRIHDTFHDILPVFNPEILGFRIRDIYVFALTVPILFTEPKIAIEFLKKYLIIILIRCVAINLTILPNASKDCVKGFDLIKGCFDKVFSGHFSTLFLASLMYYKYSIINAPLLVSVNFINAFLIIASRSHYSIDIFVAFFVTLFIFQQKIN